MRSNVKKSFVTSLCSKFVNHVDLVYLMFVGLFTLLMYDFGVKGVEVEEVYDLTKPIDK